jgi:hypothetical protein
MDNILPMKSSKIVDPGDGKKARVAVDGTMKHTRQG